jgi:squalene-hopene/tetraprenyl-beta-curcumene cyclase
MNRHLRGVLTLAFTLLAAQGGGQARGEDPGTALWRPKAAAQYLDGRADWWLNWSGSARGQGTSCLSCHTSLPFALARPALGEHLGEAPGAAEKRTIGNVIKRVDNWDKIVAHSASDKTPFLPFYSGNRKPSALGTEAVLNALVLVNYDARRSKGALSASTQKALGHLWQQQQKSGAWLWLDFGLNPWEKDGAYYGASLAAVAVGTAGKDYYERADIQAKVTALKNYLKTQSAREPLHHRAVALWASSRLPGVLTDDDKQKLVEELLSVQEADGGWTLAKLGQPALAKGNWKSHGVYPEGAAGDGYATGLVVLALKRAGVPADNGRLQKGVAWLAGREREGTWPLSYPNRARNPQDNIGKFMRDAATAFAVLALTEPTQPVHRNGNRDRNRD